MCGYGGVVGCVVLEGFEMVDNFVVLVGDCFFVLIMFCGKCDF